MGVAQLVERWIVVPVAEGSNPSTHPIKATPRQLYANRGHRKQCSNHVSEASAPVVARMWHRVLVFWGATRALAFAVYVARAGWILSSLWMLNVSAWRNASARAFTRLRTENRRNLSFSFSQRLGNSASGDRFL